MPTIEIISIRFNLDKEDDRKLFEALQRRFDSGKRNELLKQALQGCLVGDVQSGKPIAAPTPEKRQKAKSGQPAVSDDHKASAAPRPDPESTTSAARPLVAADEEHDLSQHEEPAGDSSENAGVVASFVQ